MPKKNDNDPVALENELETLMMQRVQDLETEKREREREREQGSESRLQRIHQLIEEYYLHEFGEVEIDDGNDYGDDEGVKDVVEGEVAAHQQHDDENLAQKEKEGAEKSAKEPSLENEQKTNGGSVINDDHDTEQPKEEQPQEQQQGGGLVGKLLAILATFFRRLRCVLIADVDQKQMTGAAAVEEDKEGGADVTDAEAEAEKNDVPTSGVEEISSFEQPKEDKEPKQKERRLEDIADDIFQEYIANHMTLSTYHMCVRRFIESPRAQNNLDEQELTDLENDLLDIARNFGCTKSNFAKDTGGVSATGEAFCDREEFGNNFADFSATKNNYASIF